MTDIDRIRFVVSHFQSLKGLRLFPIGLLFIANYFPFTGWVPSIANRPESAWFGWAALAVALLGFIAVPWYYRAKVGQMEQPPDVKDKALMATWLGIAVIFVSLVAAYFLERETDLPLMARAILGVAVFLGIWGLSGWSTQRLYYPIIALGFLLANFIPYLEGVAPLDRAAYFRLDCTLGSLIGIGLMFCGLLDHYLLVKNLHPVPREDLEIGIASAQASGGGGAHGDTL